MKEKLCTCWARATMTLLLAVLCSVVVRAQSAPTGVSIDNDYAPGEEGYYYVNIPQHSGPDGAIVTFTESSASTIKVYDHAGKSANYSDCNGWLTLQAPEGYQFRVSGKCWLATGTFMTFYTNDRQDHQSYNYESLNVSYVCETNKMEIQFNANKTYYGKGTELTVKVFNPTSLNDGVIEGISSFYAWTGSAIDLSNITVKNGAGTTLTKDVDYVLNLSSEDVVNTGTYTLTVTPAPNSSYTGSLSYTFKVVKLEGEGTTAAPYQIADETDLQAMAYFVNNLDGYNTKIYKQTANITLTEDHSSIGTSSRPFKGTYDGKNGDTQYAITHLTINKSSSEYQGLFGYTEDATIRNVHLIDCNITGKTYVGGIVGYLYHCTIENCVVSGTIGGSSGAYHGGIVGYTKSGNGYTLRNCFSDAIVTGSSNVGSIAGYAYYSAYSGITISDNYHTPRTTGGCGEWLVTTGSDYAGRYDVAAKITAGDGVTIGYPATPTYIWDGENYYKDGTVVTLNYSTPTGKVFDHYTVSSGTISYAGIIDGEHTLSNFSDNVEITGVYADNMTNLTDGNGTIDAIEVLTYNGQVQHPVPVVRYNGEPLVEGTNYTVSYSEGCINANTNDNTYTVTVTGIGRYSGSLSTTFTITPYDINGENAVTVSGLYSKYANAGSGVPPAPKVIRQNVTLASGTDYDLSYSGDYTEPGNYEGTITAKGNYTGTISFPFTIASGLALYDSNESSSETPFRGSRVHDYYQKYEYVIPATGLASINGNIITGMEFYLSSKTTSSMGNARFRIFMKEVEQENYSNAAFIGTDNATIVYEGPLDGTQDVMNIPFTTPYIYQGGNLLVGIYEYEKGTSVSGMSFYGTLSGGNKTFYGLSNSSLDNISGKSVSFMPKTTFWCEPVMTITDAAIDNSTNIANNDKNTMSVILKDRTLYKDGKWNTICLPFNVTLENSPLAGATAKTLTDATMTGTTLTLSFGDDVTELTAGTPYIIKWDNDVNQPTLTEDNLIFTNATIDKTDRRIVKADGNVKFIGYYDAFTVNTPANDDIYYLTADDLLKHTSVERTLNACRAYFQFTENTANARYVLNIDGDATGILEDAKLPKESSENVWFDLQGRRLNGKPTENGLYINNGKVKFVK